MKKIVLAITVLGAVIISSESFAQSKKGKKEKKSKKELIAEPAKDSPGRPSENKPEPPRATPTLPTPAPMDTPPRGNEDRPKPDRPTDNTPTPPKPDDVRPTPTQEVRPTPVPQEQTSTPKPTPVDDIIVKSEPVITTVPNGNVNWTEQFIYAVGESVIDNERFKNPAQAKAMATRGAVVVAQRNLLEIIKGVNVTSETTVQDMITTSDFIYTRIDGVIKGAQQVGEAIEKNGMMQVRMRVSLYEKDGLGPIVAENIPSAKKITNNPPNQEITNPEPDAAEALDKIVFNFKGKKIDPSMFPVIVDQNNNMVFDYAKIYDPKSGKFPQIVKTSDQLLKDLGYSKGVKVLDVISADKGKLVIDNKNLKKVNWQKIGNTAAKIGKFLLMLL
jgi:hypothetical protein